MRFLFSTPGSTGPGAGAAGPSGPSDPGPGVVLDWADGTTNEVYGLGGVESYSAAQPPGYGTGGTFQPTTDTGVYYPGANGFVLVRVPAEYAQGVTET